MGHGGNPEAGPGSELVQARDQHPAPVMDQQPSGQAGAVRQWPQQRYPGMRHDPGTVSENFQ